MNLGLKLRGINVWLYLASRNYKHYFNAKGEFMTKVSADLCEETVRRINKARSGGWDTNKVEVDANTLYLLLQEAIKADPIIQKRMKVSFSGTPWHLISSGFKAYIWYLVNEEGESTCLGNILAKEKDFIKAIQRSVFDWVDECLDEVVCLANHPDIRFIATKKVLGKHTNTVDEARRLDVTLPFKVRIVSKVPSIAEPAPIDSRRGLRLAPSESFYCIVDYVILPEDKFLLRFTENLEHATRFRFCDIEGFSLSRLESALAQIIEQAKAFCFPTHVCIEFEEKIDSVPFCINGLNRRARGLKTPLSRQERQGWQLLWTKRYSVS